MTIHAPHHHKPQPVHPSPPGTKNYHLRRARNGPPIFTALLVLALAAALVRLYYILQMPAVSSTAFSNCANYLHSFDYTKIVTLEPGDGLGAVESVDTLDGGAPATLVQALHSDTQLSIDVYVFGCTMQHNQLHVTTLFEQRGLVEGSVEVSPAHTLVTGTLDPSLSVSAGVLLLPAQQNVYREYAWTHGAFRQVAFPGLYPVASRAEAEALQQQANNGQSLPWSDPLETAQAMAKDLFQWSASDSGDPGDALISSDGTTAQVQLVQSSRHLTLDITLQRLVQRDSKGLWFVVAAHSQGNTLNLNGQVSATLPATSTQSPLTLAGTGALAGGQTSATLFDHTLTPLSSASSVPIPVSADGTFSGSLPYTTSVSGQQAVLLITSMPQATSVEQGQLLLVPLLLG